VEFNRRLDLKGRGNRKEFPGKYDVYGEDEKMKKSLSTQ